METLRIDVPGGSVVAYSIGEGEQTVVVISGGPGASCDYMRESHKQYADQGFRVVAWDQLGTGQSDRPDDLALWTISRFVAELEAVRSRLDLGSINIVGNSWGGILGLEYCLAYPEQVRRFVMGNIATSIPLMNLGFKQCRMQLGIETAKMMSLRELEGTVDHPEYKAAVTLLIYRHMCRMETFPKPVQKLLSDFGPALKTMFGPHLFHCTGTLAEWDRTPDLQRLTMPVLLVTGEHDYVLPEYVAIGLNHLQDGRLRIFRGCGHLPFYEDPESYHTEVLRFLRET